MYFFIVNVLGIELTEMKNFHSHLETLYVIPPEDLHNQPVLSGGTMQYENDNLVAVPYLFDPSIDPFKFRSLHCYLFPEKCGINPKQLLVGINNIENSNDNNIINLV